MLRQQVLLTSGLTLPASCLFSLGMTFEWDPRGNKPATTYDGIGPESDLDEDIAETTGPRFRDR